MSIHGYARQIKEILDQGTSLIETALHNPINTTVGDVTPTSAEEALAMLLAAHQRFDALLYQLILAVNTHAQVNSQIGDRYYVVTFSSEKPGEAPSLSTLAGIGHMEGPWTATEGGKQAAISMARARRASTPHRAKNILVLQFNPKTGTTTTIDIEE